MSDRYAVMGNPVAHSRSPQIHARFARQTGQDIEYRRILVPADGFEHAARAFFAAGGKGLNVTLPFKQDAWRFADRHSDRAREAGAVNTLALAQNGEVHGDNTDGVGLVRDLEQNLGWSLRDQRLLLLGAGGAARGVLGPLLDARPRELVIANRTAARALALADAFGSRGEVNACALEDLAGAFDLIINATSASLAGDVPILGASLAVQQARCYDMAYASGDTPFIAWARAAGAPAVADGLGMLVEQAAESFFIWRGVRPATAPVIDELRVPVAIRPADGEQDLRIAAELFREYQRELDVDLCFQDFERELATLPGAYAAPAGTLLLAWRGERALGCVALRPVADGVCEMKRLYVRDEGRGAGLGRALALRAIEAGRKAGYRSMRLDTLDRLREAMTLYESLGFRRIAPYYANPLGDVVYWERELQETGS